MTTITQKTEIIITKPEPTCLRCGKCCYYLKPDNDGNMQLKKCRHLVRLYGSKTTLCRMYNKRKLLRYQNGIVIDRYIDKNGIKHDVWCVWRDNSPFNHQGCPYNKKGQKYFATYCEQNNVRYKE